MPYQKGVMYVMYHQQNTSFRLYELRNRLFLTSILVIILILLIWFAIVIPIFVNFQLDNYLQQRLTVLSPTISDEKYKEFKAKWALMKNRDDYSMINREMDDIAKIKGTTLPKPLIK